MKLSQVNLPDLISERLKFIPRCPEKRDFRYALTSSGEFKFKIESSAA